MYRQYIFIYQKEQNFEWIKAITAQSYQISLMEK